MDEKLYKPIIFDCSERTKHYILENTHLKFLKKLGETFRLNYN